MNYRDILGMSDKQPKKKIVKKRKPSVTEGLKKEFGDTINEGPAYEFAKEYKNLEKLQEEYYKAMVAFARKIGGKGFRKEAKHLERYYNKFVRFGWKEYLDDLYRKLQ